jgi:transcription-repair coupling factor (superfamily II helicase)
MLVKRGRLAASTIGEDMRSEIGDTGGMAAAARFPDPVTEPACVGDVATQIAEALRDSHIVFLARDEQRAEAIAAALRVAAPECITVHYPSSDALPGDTAPASPANVGHRVAALRRVRIALRSTKRIALVTTGEAAARLYPQPSCFDATPPTVESGDAIDIDAFAGQLRDMGYSDDDRVDEPGEVAVRGQVIDIFPADAEVPIRLEILEERVSKIRAFDPATQRGLEELSSVEVGRAMEPSEPSEALLFEHLPDASVLIESGALERRDRFVTLAEDARRRRGETASEAADISRWTRALGNAESREVTVRSEDFKQNFAVDANPLRAASRAIKTALGRELRVLLVGASRDIRFLARRLTKATGALTEVSSWAEAIDAKPGSFMMLPMVVDRGWLATGIMVIAAADILGSRAARFTDASSTAKNPIFGSGDIRLGDVVVHEEHGIGRISGLQKLAGGTAADSEGLHLEYAGGAMRILPIEEADRLWRYGADADAVTLDRIDGTGWTKRREVINAAIAESAQVLADLARERSGKAAPVLEAAGADYERFVAGFGYTETADQARAIDAVRQDLTRGAPMDRLIVGDVGYGKTEVVMRAAAIVALCGKQVAIAAPTTVLVRQHLDNFSRRFEPIGIRVAGLSRLASAAEKKAVKAGLSNGSISIVIGTGAIAGTDVTYKDLGLVAVDEEQRFGAADKHKMRALGNGHVLTLSATPIPRSLQMALIGLQDVSLIATPPAKRQPIRTALCEYDPTTLRTALLRERTRGGQSFVVVPRIEDMAQMAAKLADLVPELTVRQAHGKMPTAEIDEAMVAFAAGTGDILLATNIIEAGLDVPRANTMIVWRADRFGLAQLHQLRGRVGRGGRRGQIILFTEPGGKLAEATIKRLRTLEAFDRLGAGFEISARDLDLRGAGDLIGEAQAGHLKLIGVDLYQHLLGRALRAVRGEVFDDWTPEIHVGAAGFFPEDWIPDADLRIGLYCRLARLSSARELTAFEEELEDRFGSLPEQAEWLLEIAHIRIAARGAGVTRIDAGPEAIAFRSRGEKTPLERAGFERKGERWLLAESIADPSARLSRVRDVLERLDET